jgi:CubicO group peptidase (beta-lactamase class C family)
MLTVQLGIDWAGVALERATGLKLNDYLQQKVLKPLGISEMSMIPSHEMRSKLAYMHHRSPDGVLRPRNHLLRQPLVVDPEDKAEVGRIFNSGGAGMFANPRDYCSKSIIIATHLR